MDSDIPVEPASVAMPNIRGPLSHRIWHDPRIGVDGCRAGHVQTSS